MSALGLRTIRRTVPFLMGAVFLAGAYYTAQSLYRAWRFCFGEPERWEHHWRVDPLTVVEMPGRINYFVFWIAVIACSAAAYALALVVLNRVRRGDIYSHATARLVRLLGLVLMGAMLIDTLFGALQPWLITRYNFVREPIAYVYDPSDIKTMILAVILFLFGWVMTEATRIDAENKEFV